MIIVADAATECVLKKQILQKNKFSQRRADKYVVKDNWE